MMDTRLDVQKDDWKVGRRVLMLAHMLDTTMAATMADWSVVVSVGWTANPLVYCWDMLKAD